MTTTLTTTTIAIVTTTTTVADTCYDICDDNCDIIDDFQLKANCKIDCYSGRSSFFDISYQEVETELLENSNKAASQQQ